MAPVAGVGLVDANAGPALVLSEALSALPFRALRQQWHCGVLRPECNAAVFGEVVHPPHHSLAAVTLTLWLEEVWVSIAGIIQLLPVRTVVCQIVKLHQSSVLGVA